MPISPTVSAEHADAEVACGAIDGHDALRPHQSVSVSPRDSTLIPLHAVMIFVKILVIRE